MHRIAKKKIEKKRFLKWAPKVIVISQMYKKGLIGSSCAQREKKMIDRLAKRYLSMKGEVTHNLSQIKFSFLFFSLINSDEIEAT